MSPAATASRNAWIHRAPCSRYTRRNPDRGWHRTGIIRGCAKHELPETAVFGAIAIDAGARTRLAVATARHRLTPRATNMDGFFRDLRYTVRNMGRSPGLAVVIAVSLALGIGANTAIFSLIRAVMMKSLPVQDPDRLVLVHWHGDTWPRGLNQSGSGGPSGYAAASRSQAYPFFRELRKETGL